MHDLEATLRETFERHAQSISTQFGGGDALISSVMQRRRRRTATIYAATLGPAAVIASFAVRPGSDGSDVQTAPGATQAGTSTQPTPPVASTLPPRTTAEPTLPSTWPPSEPLATSGEASCVEEYSPTNLANRAFAFDGTVVAIREVTEPELTGSMVEVDFAVNEWFRAGDDEATATVEMFDPESLTSVDQTGLDAWTVGTRLLITGEPRWGGDPLDNAVAWYCGFSRTYNPDVAATWRAALAANRGARP